MAARGAALHDFWQVCRPWPKQEDLFLAALQFRYVLFGGSRGPGKSWALRWCGILLLLWYAAKGHRGVRIGLFCETFPELEERQISKVRLEFPTWLGVYHETHYEFRLRKWFGGGVLCFRNLDKPAKYKSAEFAAILVDELTRILPDVFHVLRGSLRWPGIDHSPFIAATNPDGVGHLWVKQLWIDRDFSSEEFKPIADEVGVDQFVFIPALPADNPSLTEEYWRTLRSLPTKLRKAWMEGNWDAFEGQYFDEWDKQVHTMPAFKIPEWWERAGGLDWGYSPHPGWLGWFAFDQYGRPYGYKELVFEKLSGYQLAEAIASRCTTPAERRMLIVADTQMWAPQPGRQSSKGEGISIAQDVNDRLAELGTEITLVQANKDRLNGWMRVHTWLDVRRPLPDGPGHGPWCRIFQPDPGRGLGMPYLIRTVPSLIHDEKGTGDLDTKGVDHAADGWRYLAMKREPLAEIPLEELPPVPHHVQVHRRIQRKMMKRLMALDRGEDPKEAEREEKEPGPLDEEYGSGHVAAMFE